VQLVGQGKLKIIPTDYGNILAALPFGINDCRVIVSAGQLSLLHEALALMVISSHKPNPIVHHFADPERNEKQLKCFYPAYSSGNHNSLLLANLSAFMFWDYEWNKGRTFAAMKKFEACISGENTSNALPSWLDEGTDFYGEMKGDESDAFDCNVWEWTPECEIANQSWCKVNGLNPAACRSIAEAIDVSLEVMFNSRFEPEFLRTSQAMPKWCRPTDWKGGEFSNKRMMISRVYGRENAATLCKALSVLITSQGTMLSAKPYALSMMTKNHPGADTFRRARVASHSIACVHFLQGNCSFGDRCRNSHSSSAVKPECRFYPNCTNRNCPYSHGGDDEYSLYEDDDIDTTDPLDAVAPLILDSMLQDGVAAWFEEESAHLLLLGEGDLSFTTALIREGFPPFAASTLNHCNKMVSHTRVFPNIDATRVHNNAGLRLLVGNGYIRSFAWNFPFTGKDENEEIHEKLLSGAFHSIALLFQQNGNVKGLFAITLQGDQFSRWSVLRSGRRAGWQLKSWDDFDSNDFSGYVPARANGDPFPVHSARIYVFEMMEA
jgi:hypothetical protein